MEVPPERGTLDATPLPVLLLSAYRQRHTGQIDLTREAVRKRVWLRDGVPVLAESNLPSESLGIQLLDAGILQRDDYARLVDTVRERGCKEGAALLSLELVGPQQLFVALKNQVRRRLLDCFGWPCGEFAVHGGEAPGGDAAAFRCDPVALAQEGIAIHWSPTRIREDLAARLDRYPQGDGRFSALAGRLLHDADVDRLLACCDGTQSLGELFAATPTPSALAAVWVLDRLGALQWRTKALVEETTTTTESDIEQPDFEIVVGSAGTAGTTEDPPSGEPAPARPQRQTDPATDGPEFERLAREIRELHAALGERDHYELLGVPRSAPLHDVKRAYFAAAKRFHPDALARLGLADLRVQAEEVFARIARAYETLSDPGRRRDYDHGLDRAGADADAQRVVQAEALYRKAEIMMRAGNWSGAHDFLRPAVQLWPEECAYQSALGWALYKKTPSDPGTARTHLERAVALDGEDSISHFRLGLVLRALGDSAAAERELKRAKQLDPKVQ
jgi:tetratricopeptide (TPR) repeat protein